jgi:hypothetical protein
VDEEGVEAVSVDVVEAGIPVSKAGGKSYVTGAHEVKRSGVEVVNFERAEEGDTQSVWGCFRTWVLASGRGEFGPTRGVPDTGTHRACPYPALQSSLISLGVGVAGCIEPVDGHAFAVARGGEQTVDGVP